MQYTIRAVPPEVDAVLRRRAQEQGKSVNAVVIEALRSFAGLVGRPRDLSWLAGTWDDDPEVEAALDVQRGIDSDLWA